MQQEIYIKKKLVTQSSEHKILEINASSDDKVI